MLLSQHPEAYHSILLNKINSVKMLLVNGDFRKLWKTSKHTKQELRLWHHFKGSTTTLQGLKVAKLDHQIRFKEEISGFRVCYNKFCLHNNMKVVL